MLLRHCGNAYSVLSTFFLPSDVAESADEVHDAISTPAIYSPLCNWIYHCLFDQPVI